MRIYLIAIAFIVLFPLQGLAQGVDFMMDQLCYQPTQDDPVSCIKQEFNSYASGGIPDLVKMDVSKIRCEERWMIDDKIFAGRPTQLNFTRNWGRHIIWCFGPKYETRPPKKYKTRIISVDKDGNYEDKEVWVDELTMFAHGVTVKYNYENIWLRCRDAWKLGIPDQLGAGCNYKGYELQEKAKIGEKSE